MKILLFACLIASTFANDSIESEEDLKEEAKYSQCASIPEFMTNKIVGGQTAPRPIPWQVSIRSHGSHFCGGTILDATTVLSAGHCFDGGNRNGLSILAGTVNRKDKSGQVSDIEKVLWNKDPGFVFQGIDNDMVVLKLTQRLTFNENVRPACLPSSGYNPMGNELCFVSGWGTLNSGAHYLPGDLQWVRVPPVSCGSSYPGQITDAMFCAGFPQGGKDSCQGDSGGPYVCNVGGKAVVTGIVSFGKGCALAGYPGVYTRVTKFVNWIKQRMERNYVETMEDLGRPTRPSFIDLLTSLFGFWPRYPYIFDKQNQPQPIHETKPTQFLPFLPYFSYPYPMGPQRPYQPYGLPNYVRRMQMGHGPM